ncbi:MAG: lipocalin-like domain-containing protein [Betaproteobacteria bacterium]
MEPARLDRARRRGRALAALCGRRAAARRERFVEAALHFNSYGGRYSIEGDRVHHDVEVALFPDWIGKRLTRAFRVDGPSLTLSFEADGQTDVLRCRSRAPRP